MAKIPAQHEKYDILPRSREGGWEVFSYPAFLSEVDEALADVEIGPRAEPGEARPSLLMPYGYESVEEYLGVLDAYKQKYAGTPLADELSRLAWRIELMNRKEEWSVLRYVGPEGDSVLGLTPGRCYYWPTSAAFPFYDGVIDDEEFISYVSHSISPEYWEILEDPTDMAADTMAGRRATYRTAFPKRERNLSEDELGVLHKLSCSHAKEVSESDTCGCFYCVSVFPASDVDEWIDELDGEETALCPYCGIDAVLPEASVQSSGFELGIGLLSQMEQHWFDMLPKRRGTLCLSLPISAGKVEAKVNGGPFAMRVSQRIYDAGEGVAVPYWCLDCNLEGFSVGDVITVGVEGANFVHDDGDERSELLVAEAEGISVGFCGYEPGYHGDIEAKLHCFELLRWNEEGFTYRVVRDPASCAAHFQNADSIPLAVCEISHERFNGVLAGHFDDMGTALALATMCFVG